MLPDGAARGYRLVRRAAVAAAWKAIAFATVHTQRWRPTGRPIYNGKTPQRLTDTGDGPVVHCAPNGDFDGFADEVFDRDRDDANPSSPVRLAPVGHVAELQRFDWPAPSATLFRHRVTVQSRYAGAMVHEPPRVYRRAKLTDGHSNTAFAWAHSYVWGIPCLIHRINTTATDPAFACGDLSRLRLINGAVACNGGGVPDYRQRIIDALTEFGDPLADTMPLGLARAEALRTAIIAAQNAGFPVSRLHLAFGPEAEVAKSSIDFAPRAASVHPGLEALAVPAASGDFAIGQRAPDVDEISACGAIAGRIARGTPEFAGLVEVTGSSSTWFVTARAARSRCI